MSIVERDVVNQSVDGEGNQTVDFPLARLGWIEDTAEVKAAPAAEDYIPIADAADGGQMKKTLMRAVAEAVVDMGAVPTTRKVNGKPLSADVTLAAADVGALASGGTAVKSTADAKGQNIATTYIKGLSVSGKTITYTKGDGATGTITTQDTNTTYSAATQSAAGLLSAADKKKLDGIAAGAQVNPTALKNPKALTLQLNGTSQGGYDGSAAKTVNITPAGIGAAPTASPVFTDSISMGRKEGTTVGVYSFAVGYNVEASGDWGSHAEGYLSTASGDWGSHAEGNNNTASGNDAHAEGCQNTASGSSAHAEGNQNTASGSSAHVEGFVSDAIGEYSHAEGTSSEAAGDSSHAEGSGTTASNYASHAGGHYNKAMTDGGSFTNTIGDAMVIGNGTPSGLSNCFRVTYTGAVYGLSSFKTSGADYAEFFEWADGNPDAEDRVGFFVALEGKFIRPAKPGDYILGAVSGQPCIIGNADEDWLGRWQHDEFGRFILEYLEDEETELSTEGLSEEEIFALRREPDVRERDGRLCRVTAKVADHETPSWRYKANPDYDSTQRYVERQDRQEWSAVGMLGVLSVRDDGTCQPNGYCKVAEGGIATAADAELAVEDGRIVKGYRVLERVSEHVVRIVFR